MDGGMDGRMFEWGGGYMYMMQAAGLLDFIELWQFDGINDSIAFIIGGQTLIAV